MPAANLKGLITHAKGNPGKLNFASPGIGSSPHLTGEMLQTDAGVRFTRVPYKGMGRRWWIFWQDVSISRSTIPRTACR
ncbi:tripartite tricarboxylate transporter substrate-binding protein [Bradyrhizobium sp.]|uniref:tripartite tricarboxylate transporter substrate-binding protein n=1 Tax=Bradyrhizobium sp. TaxID=376 RepID=UPI003C6EA985